MTTPSSQRNYWINILEKTATPVFSALAAGELKNRMPVEIAHGASRAEFSHLEAFGRAFDGIAPWLELGGLSGEEESRRAKLAELVIRSIDKATDPASPDCLNFAEGHQPIVDGAFFAQGLLRSRTRIWDALDARVQKNVIRCLKSTRSRKPPFNNWLLFSATIEAFLGSVGEDWDRMRIDYAIRQHEQWYKGDGIYGDGPFYHWDYYNSFVIQPMLLDVSRAVAKLSDEWKSFDDAILKRAQRYAFVLERLIATDGTFPPFGRSITYRLGVFHHLAYVAALDLLPGDLKPAQVRCALTAVIRKVMESNGTFDENGWLRIGLCGHQPSLAEPYISTGSLYLCLGGWAPLGLAPGHAFWSAPDEQWSQQKIWSGENFPGDHAINDYEFHHLSIG